MAKIIDFKTKSVLADLPSDRVNEGFKPKAFDLEKNEKESFNISIIAWNHSLSEAIADKIDLILLKKKAS